jgi:hypothetical protein
VNSEVIPYFVLPSEVGGVRLGDVAFVYNTSNGKGCYAIYADTGPSGSLGEGSMYLAVQLGIDDNPRTGGVQQGIIDYIIFPNSGYGQGVIPTVKQINNIGASHMKKLGGLRITKCL